MTDDALVDKIFARYVEHLVAEGDRPDLEELAGGDPALLSALRRRIEVFDRIDRALDQEFEPLSGKSLIHYSVLELLGAGGMGQVYRAEDMKLGREVAIKVLPPIFACDQKRLARFEREARLLAALNHRNVGAIHGLEQAEGLHFLVLELVPGETLAERIDGSALPLDEALPLFCQIARGLEAAHDKDIIHRDLKPANIKITPEGEVKLLDFGLGKSALESGPDDTARSPVPTQTATQAQAATQAGVILGTASYMSPEQARGGSVDKRTDIWSFGGVLFEALTGVTAFPGETPTQTLVSILERDPDWDALPDDVPAGIRNLLERCLEKEPDRRPDDLREVRLEIEQHFERRGDATGPNIRRGVAVIVGIALVLGLAAVAGWRILLPPPTPVSPRVPAAEKPIVPEFSGRPAIAVLPFDNLGADPEQEYFADGLAQDLITRLSSWRGFPVISHFSSFSYKGDSVDVQEVGRALGARYVVQGGVQRAGDGIRISTRLIDATTGQVVWADRYNRRIEDVLAMQEEISQAIVAAMYPELDRFDRERALRHEPGDLAAWDWAQRGWWHWNRGTPEDNAEARRSYERAVELDPRFSTAFAGLALTHYYDLSSGWTDAPEQSIQDLIEAAETAVALDDRDPSGRHALGHAYALTGERDKMIAAFDLSVELNPSSALVRSCAGESLALAGQSERAIAHLEEAIRLSPQDQGIAWTYHALALAHFSAGEYEPAVDWAGRAVNQMPDFAFAYRTLASSPAQLGRLEAAHNALDDAKRLAPEFTLAAGARVLLTAEPTVGRRYLDGLRLAGMAD